MKDIYTKQANKLNRVLAAILTIAMIITSLGITNRSVIFASEGGYAYAAEYSGDSDLSNAHAEPTDNESEIEYGGNGDNEVNDDEEVNNDETDTAEGDEKDYGYSDGEYGDSSDDKEEDDYEYGDLDKEYCDDPYCEDCALNIVPPELGGLGIVPLSGGAEIEITAFTSTNQVFTTNDSNLLPLSLQIAYRIAGEGNADGGEIRIALEDDVTIPIYPYTFFATTIERIDVMLTTTGEQHIDVAGIFVESDGMQNTLVIPFTGGENNITLDTITVNIEYNRTWDGQIAPGNLLHTFEAWTVNDGAHDPAFMIDITSNTTDTRALHSIPNQAVSLDVGFFGISSTRIFNNPATTRFWEIEEGTSLIITIDIPQGAQFNSPTTGLGAGQLIGNEQLVVEFANMQNIANHLYMSPRVQFPSEHFSDGQVVEISFTANYYLRDAISGIPVPRTLTRVVSITLTSSQGVPGGDIILGWNPPAMITMFATQQDGRDNINDNISVDNQSDLPLENLVITIYNNPDVSGASTGSKASYRLSWRIINNGNRVISNWTFFIGNINGNPQRVEQRTHNGVDVGASPSVNIITNILGGNLAAGEYIDRIEIRPQHNGQDAMPPGTEFIVRTRFSGFTTTGTDHTGGFVGANSDGLSYITQRVTITYDGLEQDFERSVVLRYVDASNNGVDAFVLRTEVRAAGGQIAPGGELPVRILARANNSHASAFGTSARWERPSFLLFVPQGASIDTSQNVKAARNLSGASLGDMTIEFLGTESTGQRVYRLQTQSGVPSLPPHNGENSNDVIRFDLNITTPFGAPAGPTSMRVWAIAYAGEGARHTLYQIGGAVAGGLTTSNGFFADVNNWTGHNHLAPYLRFTTNNLSYTVATSAGMLARAQLWNHGGNAWQLGGTATVPVGGEGRFQLEVVNSGNQFVGDVRLYNILPHSNTTNTASGAGSVISQWNATLESLSFRVYDRFGDDITSLFTGSQIWVSQQHNSNPSGNYPINRNLINTDFAAMNATNILTARSFVFDLGTRRLDPGARIVIEGNVALPATMTAADIGQTAQNSFVTSGQFFNTLTGGTAQGLTPQISDIQTFEASAENNASISGTVFRALAPGVFDGELEGVVVRLYSGGTAVSNFTGLTAISDEDGEYSFAGLAPGAYYLRFINPIASATGMSATFNGIGLTADGLNAVTSTITLNASATGHEFEVDDVGLVRTGLVQVQFRRASDNSLVNNTTHTIYSYVNLDSDSEGTVTPGATGQIAIPTGNSISGATYQDFDLTWDMPSVILVFNVTRDQFSVEYNNNGGTGSIAPQTADTNTNITLSDGTGFTRTGHTLLGWATTPTGAVTYALEATFARTTSGTTTLFAAWQPNAHTVTYQGGGHTGGSVPTVVNTNYGATVELAAQGDLARTGHTFTGWRDGSGTVHAAGATIVISGNVVLTAEWTPSDYTVTYNANWQIGDLGTLSGTVPTANNPFNYGNTVTVAANPGNLARTGHTLLGWDRTQGATTPEFPLSGTNSFTMPTDDVTLYAIWQVNAHTVTYQGGGHTGGTVPAMISTTFYAAVTLADQGTLVRVGHTFAGWRDGGGTLRAAGSEIIISGDFVLTAEWTPNDYTVTYNANWTAGDLGTISGDVPTASNPFNYGDTVTVAGNPGNLARTGHTLLGWARTSTAIAAEFPLGGTPNTFEMSAAHVTLYAVWQVNEFSVTFINNHSLIDNTNYVLPVDVNYGSSLGTSMPANPNRTGHQFLGWFANRAGTGDEFTSTTVVYDNVTVYARWQADAHTVTYVAAGTETGGTVPAVVNTYFHAEVTVTGQGTLVQDGYSFVGWRDGSNNVFKEGDTLTISGDVTLTAVWTAHYMVSYNGNGNTGGTAPLGNDYPAGAVVTVQGQGTLVRSGHTFMGWSATQGATAAEFQAGDEFIMPAAHRTLYAIWQINSHDVTVRHYTYGWNETASDAILYDEETFTVVYGEQFTAEIRDIAGHSFDVVSSDDILFTMGDSDVIISLFYGQHTYELSIVPEVSLAVNDRFPYPVDNSVTWAEFADMLEVQTIVTGGAISALNVGAEPLTGTPTLTSPNFEDVDFREISTAPFAVTVNAVWLTGQEDSQIVLVSIVDEIAPVITVTENRITFYANNPPSGIDAILAKAGVSIIDNYDGPVEPIVSFVGTTFEDINWALGNMEYAMVVDAVDSSGNATEQSEVIIVAVTAQTGGGGGNVGGNGGGNWWTQPARLVQEEIGEPISDTQQRQVHHAFLVGFENGTVQPGGTTTRAQVATIFFRLMPDVDRSRHWMQNNTFVDVTSGDWFNNAISTTANADLFLGMPDGAFQPHREITRAELAAVVARYLAEPTGMNYSGVSMFNDISGHWAEGYINAAARNGWIMGYEGVGGRFLPDQLVTRAETAAIVNRMFSRRLEDYTDLLPGMTTWSDNSNINAWYYLYVQEATNSNYFKMKADGIHKTWVELATPRPWTLLERPESRPEDIFRRQ